MKMKLRQEYKYLVPSERLPELREMILPYVELDSHAANTSSGLYTVRSIYFDTPSLQMYYEKVEGLKNRKKIRIRGYDEHNPESLLFLEIKRKYERSVTKNRALIRYADAVKVFGNGEFLPYLINGSAHSHCREDAQQFFFHLYKMQLKPTILIAYEREAFFDRLDDSNRITFDRNLRSRAHPFIDSLFSEENMIPSLSDFFVLEVKFSRGMSGWLMNIIRNWNLKWRSVSKYEICIDTQKRYNKMMALPKYANGKLFSPGNIR